MTSLELVINEMNFWPEIKGEPLLTLPLQVNQIEDVMDYIQCSLSPENLHCDGEISPKQAMRKEMMYVDAMADLAMHTVDAV